MVGQTIWILFGVVSDGNIYSGKVWKQNWYTKEQTVNKKKEIVETFQMQCIPKGICFFSECKTNQVCSSSVLVKFLWEQS